MQLAGTQCRECRESIPTEADGTWCATCRVTFHEQCVTPGQPCPACVAPFVRGQERRQRSRKCPECGAPQPGGVDRCLKCGGRVVFDTMVEYVNYRKSMQSYGQRHRLIAIGEIVGGVLLLLGPLIGYVAVAFLISDGIIRLSRALRALAFE